MVIGAVDFPIIGEPFSTRFFVVKRLADWLFFSKLFSKLNIKKPPRIPITMGIIKK